MKKAIIAIVGIIVIVVVGLLIFNRKSNDPKKEKEDVKETKQVDNIDKYGYTLFDNKSKAYKEKFSELKEVLNEEEIDDKKYAKVVAELFTIDFYDLNSKVSNTDIGGLEFIHKDAKDDFVKTSEDTIYKYIKSNVYGGRKQELPVVTSAEATITETNYQGKKVQDENAYIAEVDITYKKDLKYPTKVSLTIVHDEKKLYVVVIK